MPAAFLTPALLWLDRQADQALRRLAALHPGQPGILQQHEPRPWSPPRPAPPSTAAADRLPRITLVTPSFQQAEFLPLTLESVLDQHYPKLDYIVVDGGSADGSAALIAARADRLAWWVSEPDGGQGEAIVKGFAHMAPETEIMAWLNSDDVLAPGALHRVGTFFATHPEVDVIYSHRVILDRQGREIGRWILPEHDDTFTRWRDFIPQETLFWRRRIWERSGGLDTRFHFALDWDLILRFQEAGAVFRRLPCTLAAFRHHRLQKTVALQSTTGKEEVARLRERSLGPGWSPRELRRRTTHYLLRSALASWSAPR